MSENLYPLIVDRKNNINIEVYLYIYIGKLFVTTTILLVVIFCEFLLQRLYEQGARNFWIHNTGPLGCLPENIARFGTHPWTLDEHGCVNSHNTASKLFNQQLNALCKKLQGQYTDAKVMLIDIFTIKFDLIANHSRYGKCKQAIFETRSWKKNNFIDHIYIFNFYRF